MEFLKSIFGDKSISYDEFVNAINAHNGNEANKENQIKLANLGAGGYVSTDKYSALETDKNGLQGKLDEANTLIETLKKSTKTDETLQGKITEYENKVADLTKQLNQEKINNAVNLAIRDANGLDADYLAYKLREKGELELDENGKIKGIDDKISELKTAYPNQFGSTTNGGNGLKVDPVPLPEGDKNSSAEPKSLAEALEQSYNAQSNKNI